MEESGRGSISRDEIVGQTRILISDAGSNKIDKGR